MEKLPGKEKLISMIENLQKLQEQNQDLDPAETTGTQKVSESECSCNQFGSFSTVLKACHLYKTPFGSTCSMLRQKWQEELRSAGVHKRFWAANFPAIEGRQIPAGLQEPYARVKSFAAGLAGHLKKGSGLILKGPVGTMKTTLAVALLQEGLLQGYSVRKVLMQSLLDEIFTLKARSMSDWLKFEQSLREARLLVVDELGKHGSEGWVMTKFESIVSERHERRRSTIFVTNLAARELKGLYSEGVIDRFNHVNEIINFKGESVRVQGD